MIIYTSDDIKMPCFPKRKISLWIKRIAEKQAKRVGEVSYIFCSDRKILEINKSYLNHDYYTDIITFDYTADTLISGDIFISVDTVRSNAVNYGVVFENELFRVIIHGILHLCGIDDKAPGARVVMEKYEDEALQILKEIGIVLQ
ncbi:MAG: rRNA maturation RNase YbeY [Tannerella sp.]|jgi:rRNA maturation RNase YbeY|nr:rRNA maturation RNase YbeY [Tannerella sp.]